MKLFFLVFIFGQLVRINLGGITIHPLDVAAGLVVGRWLVRGGIRRIGDIGDIRGITVWAAAMAGSLFVNFWRYEPREIFMAGLYGLRWVVYAGLYGAVREASPSAPFDCAQGRLLRVSLAGSLKAAAVAVAIIGLGQYLLLPDVSFLAAAEWDDHFFRLTFPFLDPGFTGMILVLALLAIFNLKFSISRGLVLGVVFPAMVLTYSRAAYLAYLVGFGVVAWYKKSARVFAGALLVLLLAIFFLPPSFGEGTKLTRENSIAARINNWKETLAVWRGAPVFGVGFNAYRYATGKAAESHAGAGADSSLLLVLATTGILGTLGYLGVLGEMWRKGGVLFRASLAAVFVNSFFNNTLFYPWVMGWLWVLLATEHSER